MNSIQMYAELCRIDMINNNLETMYPYTLQDDVQFTQHELVLHYKKNYCKNINVLEDSALPKNESLILEGGGTDASYVYMFFAADLE